METETIIIQGNIPSKSNCYKIVSFGGHASLAKTPAIKAYENAFYIQIPPKYRNIMISGYFELHVDVFYPSQRSDLDNSLKVCLDCLQKAKVIKNDNKCVYIQARKALDKDNPRIEFKIKSI
jgi:Holliday junction resolvase RusA-like endonuclease